ncbi:MAG: hypothetical protein C4527_24980 [Candidatus Omnitrophota bacterium]|jgi:formylglycine-generating enzyme required for sulfatase activity|nr:MAG: hypothetical protein C4527_24980 [Candidatus Omnitrophota bacterium]
MRNRWKCLAFIYFIFTLQTAVTSIEPVAPEMIVIPAGDFIYGTNEETRRQMFVPLSEPAQQTVYCPTFAIGKYEVTEMEFERFVLDAGYETDRYWSEEGLSYRRRYRIHKKKFLAQTERKDFENKSRAPVCGASWYEAEAYCAWLSEKTGRLYRLPTDMEWEKAARGTDGRLWPWGNEWNPSFCNWMDREDHGAESFGGLDGNAGAAPVGSYPQGASPFGCMDMAGNVQEWCSDWFDLKNPVHKILRGGSFYTSNPRNLRCARRRGLFPELAFVDRLEMGFRLASDE